MQKNKTGRNWKRYKSHVENANQHKQRSVFPLIVIMSFYCLHQKALEASFAIKQSQYNPFKSTFTFQSYLHLSHSLCTHKNNENNVRQRCCLWPILTCPLFLSLGIPTVFGLVGRHRSNGFVQNALKWESYSICYTISGISSLVNAMCNSVFKVKSAWWGKVGLHRSLFFNWFGEKMSFFCLISKSVAMILNYLVPKDA